MLQSNKFQNMPHTYARFGSVRFRSAAARCLLYAILSFEIVISGVYRIKCANFRQILCTQHGQQRHRMSEHKCIRYSPRIYCVSAFWCWRPFARSDIIRVHY